MWPLRAWQAYLALAVLAMLPRLFYFLDVVRHDPYYLDFPAGTDMRTFQDWASSIAAGDWVGRGIGVFPQAPLYPYFVGVLYTVFGSHPAVVYAVQQLLGVLTVLLIARLGERLFSRGVGLLAGLLWAFYGVGMVYEMKLLLSSLLTALTVGSVLLLLRADRTGRPRDWILAGIALAGGILGRPNTLPLILVLLPWRLMRRGRPERARALREWGIVAATVALLILPVTVRNRTVGGRWELISDNGAANFFTGNNPQAIGCFDISQLEMDLEQRYAGGRVPWFREAMRFVTGSPGRWAALTLKKNRMFWHAYEIPNDLNTGYMRAYSPFLRLPWVPFGLISILSILGMVLCFRRWRDLFPLYAFVVTLWLTIVFLFVVDRFRLPATSLLTLFAAQAVFWTAGRIRARDLRRVGGAAVALGLLTPFIFFMNPLDVRPPERMWAMNYAKSLADAGRYREAVREGERARSLGPIIPADQAFLGKLYYTVGEYGRAAQAILTGVRDDSSSVTVSAVWQDFCQAIATQPDVAASYEEWTRPFADLAEVQVGRGVLLEAAGKNDEALREFEGAVKRAPRDLMARDRLIVHLVRAQDYAGAHDQIEKARAEMPDSSYPWYRGACLSALIGDSEGALSQLLRAVELGGEDIREKASADPDLASIRTMPGFERLIAGSGRGAP